MGGGVGEGAGGGTRDGGREGEGGAGFGGYVGGVEGRWLLLVKVRRFEEIFRVWVDLFVVVRGWSDRGLRLGKVFCISLWG